MKQWTEIALPMRRHPKKRYAREEREDHRIEKRASAALAGKAPTRMKIGPLLSIIGEKVENDRDLKERELNLLYFTL